MWAKFLVVRNCGIFSRLWCSSRQKLIWKDWTNSISMGCVTAKSYLVICYFCCYNIIVFYGGAPLSFMTKTLTGSFNQAGKVKSLSLPAHWQSSD